MLLRGPWNFSALAIGSGVTYRIRSERNAVVMPDLYRRVHIYFFSVSRWTTFFMLNKNQPQNGPEERLWFFASLNETSYFIYFRRQMNLKKVHRFRANRKMPLISYYKMSHTGNTALPVTPNPSSNCITIGTQIIFRKQGLMEMKQMLKKHLPWSPFLKTSGSESIFQIHFFSIPGCCANKPYVFLGLVKF